MSPALEPLLWLGELAGASVLGGVVGAVSGLGGGIVIVPVLTLGLGLPIEDAIGASIVSVIAVSSGAGSVYVKDRLTNLRIAMFLELSTALGAIVGAGLLATRLEAHQRVLYLLFGAILLTSLAPILFRLGEELPRGVRNDPLAARLRLNGSYFDHRLGRTVSYEVTGIPAALGLMLGAGMISGVLGIGAGVVKVLAHEIAMKVPTKVSSATSNFMIGVTAAAGAGIYLHRGHVLPFLVAPVAGGALLGALLGTRLMQRLSNTHVRQVFAVALAVVGLEMLARGLGLIQ